MRLRSCHSLSFAPLGLALFPRSTHGLRRGLYSYAASRLTACGAAEAAPFQISEHPYGTSTFQSQNRDALRLAALAGTAEAAVPT